MNKLYRSYEIFTEEGFTELASKSNNYIQREYLSFSDPPYISRIKIGGGVSKILQYSNISDSVVDHILNENEYEQLDFVEKCSFNSLSDVELVNADYQLSENDIKTIYQTSSDNIPIQIDQYSKDHCVFVGVATINSLDVLANLRPFKIIFADVNAAQSKFLQFIIDLITYSEDRAGFLSNLLGKERQEIHKFLNDIQEYEMDELSDQEKLEIEDRFWSCLNSQSSKYISPSYKMLHSEFLSYNVVSEENRKKGIVFETLGKDALINKKSPSDVDIMTTFCIDDVDMIQTRPSRNGRYNPHPIYRQDGFFGSEQAYQRLRANLRNKPHIILHNPIDSRLVYTVAKSYPNNQVVVWLSNLFSGAFESEETKSMIDTITLLNSKYDVLAIENGFAFKSSIIR